MTLNRHGKGDLGEGPRKNRGKSRCREKGGREPLEKEAVTPHSKENLCMEVRGSLRKEGVDLHSEPEWHHGAMKFHEKKRIGFSYECCQEKRNRSGGTRRGR